MAAHMITLRPLRIRITLSFERFQQADRRRGTRDNPERRTEAHFTQNSPTGMWQATNWRR